MKTFRKILPFVLSAWLIFCGSNRLFGQEHSTQGTDFWLTFLTQLNERPDEASLIISAEQACTGVISNPNTGWSQDFSIGDNGRLTIVLPNEQCYITYTDTPLDLGLNIVSTDTISVYSMSYKQYTFDGSNILPTSALRSNYVIQAYEPLANGNEFAIVATEDNTIVDITPKYTTMGGHVGGSTYTINLNRGQAYQVNTDNSLYDLSGSTVVARNDKKIAVFAGNICVNVPVGSCCCDHVYEQMLPTEYWGKKFALTKTYSSNADRIRITALNDTTLVTLNGSQIASLSEYETYEFELSDECAYMESNKPILTELYITGQEYRGDKDPSMVTINPIEQVIDKIIFGTYKKDTELNHYVNIVTSSNNITSVKLDGNYISSSSFAPLTGNSDLSYAKIQISHDTHMLECNRGLIAHVYGIGNCESYAYSVGSSMRPINDIDSIYVSDSICHGEDYIEYGFEIINPEVGVITDTTTYIDEFGINKFINLTLTVNPTYDTTFIDTICKNGSYHQQGFDLDSLPVGLHFDTINPETILGCDSIVYLELYVAPIYDTTFYDTICYGNGYHEHGFELDSLSLEVGMNYDTLFLATALGCDSIVKLELYVAAVYDSTFQDVICHGNGYHQHGFELDSLELELGMNYDTLFLATTLGCDSTVYLELYVAPLYDTTFIDTTCINIGYHKLGFEIDSLELGWNYDTLFLASIHGCDSVVYLELMVNPIFDTTFYDTICYGNGYHQHGFEIEPSSLVVGMNFDTINPGTIFGCDSISYLELYVAPVYDIKLYDSICFGEDYHNYGFDFEQPEIGNHSETHELLTALACDSIVTMNLFVGEVFDITIKDTICFGDDYDKYNFHLVNLPLGINTESQSLNSIYGCDSIVNLRLYVAPVYSFDIIDSICEGEDYNKYGLDLKQMQPGYYNLISELHTELGCDSIFNVDLLVNYVYETPDTIYGRTDVFVSTDMIYGQYKYSIDSIEGCGTYEWGINNDDWIITPNKTQCEVLVTTPDTCTLYVSASNYCGFVYKGIKICASYYGLGENENVNVNVYPNPSSGYVNVEGNGVEVINILSATGVVVKRFKYEDEDNVTVDIADLPNAVYMLEIVTRDGKCMKRITKTAY